MGLSDRPGRAGTAIGLLITQRSRVQIPPPLLVSAGQGPFLSGKGPFRVRHRSKDVVGAGLRAAWQRDGGDGATRDETAWTCWTLPPAISGRVAQRSPKVHPRPLSIRAGLGENMRVPGLGQGFQRLVVASGYQEERFRSCSSSMTAARYVAVPMLRISSKARCAAQWVRSGSPRV